MELKNYQRRVIEEVEKYLSAVAAERANGNPRYASLLAWDSLKHSLKLATYTPRSNGLGEDAPRFCIKVPTGGGKTLLATQILGSIYRTLLKDRNGAGLVLWVVPSDQIYKDTLRRLRDRNDLYRLMLEHALSRRIEVWEKHELARLSPARLRDCLNILVVKLASTNRETADQLKFFRDSGGNITQHFPPESNPDAHAEFKRKTPNLDDLAAHLDIALLSLNASDRELLLRRYLQNQPVHDLAAVLHIKPNTATKRIERAVEKLRHLLTRRTATARSLLPATLTALLLEQSAIKAPAALAAAPFAAANAASLAHALSTKLFWLKGSHYTLLLLALLASVAAGITAFKISFAPSQKPTTSLAPPVGAFARITAFPDIQTNIPREPIVTVTEVIEDHSPELLTAALDSINANRALLKTLHLRATSHSQFAFHFNDTPISLSAHTEMWIDAAEPPRWRTTAEHSDLQPWRTLMEKTTPQPVSFNETWDGLTAQRFFAPTPDNIPDGASPLTRPPTAMPFIRDISYSHGKLETDRFILARPLPPNLTLLARRVLLNNQQPALEIAALWNHKPPFAFSHYYWFDESHNDALLAAWFTNDYTDEDHPDRRPRKYPQPQTETVTNELQLTAPNLWLPTQITTHTINSSPAQTTHSQLTYLSTNQPLPQNFLSLPTTIP